MSTGLPNRTHPPTHTTHHSRPSLSSPFSSHSVFLERPNGVILFHHLHLSSHPPSLTLFSSSIPYFVLHLQNLSSLIIQHPHEYPANTLNKESPPASYYAHNSPNPYPSPLFSHPTPSPPCLPILLTIPRPPHPFPFPFLTTTKTTTTMPYSMSHTLIRILQLLLSASIVITAAFLLTYRTRNHTNFTNEPLASCISGAVAFIYASWALMNHRRQPDSRRWIYLHGFWCFLVCGLLVAGSALAFVLGKQGVPCQRIRDSRDVIQFSNYDSGTGHVDVDPTDGMVGLARRSLPTYEDGVRYAPGQYCKNDYYTLDRACAILGAVAAGMWLIDLCLIFGLCGSSGQYGTFRQDEHRIAFAARINDPSSSMAYHPQRRGQVGAEEYMAEEDYYPAGGQTPPSSGHPGNHLDGDTIYNEQDQYYYDMLERRKRELEWRDQNRTVDDPKGHVQGPIPLSMQQSYYPTAYPDNVVVVREASTTAEGVMSPPVTMMIRDDFVAVLGGVGVGEGVMTALSPPPRPNSTAVINRSVQQPDSPTQTGQEDKQGQEKDQGQLPQPLQLLSSMNHTTSFSSIGTNTTNTSTSTQQPAPTPASPSVTPKTPRQTPSTPTSTRLQHKNSLPALELPPNQFLFTTTPEDSTSATSPCYVVYPPGPACYVFDSSHQEYLPSFVNMAARIEQKQHLKHSYSLSTSSPGSFGSSTGPSTPTLPPIAAAGGTGPASQSGHRVMVTGLGMEAITRSSAEIEAERLAAASTTSTQSPNTSAAATLGSTDSLTTLDLSSGLPSSPGLPTPSTTTSRPQRISMPFGSGSYFPQSQPAVGSPTGSLKSFTSRKSSDSNHGSNRPHQYLQRMHSHPHPNSPLGTEIHDNEDENENEELSQLPPQPQPQQQQQQQQLAKKPSMLKRKSSRLNIVTPTPQSPSSHNNNNSQPASASSDLQSPQHLYTPSPPRSPYIGDF
ncbi:MAG: hypothetical protein JOS17DRAFT_768354 [Linnemannia elongata]|nr:MAG: hypothetical protein JOS17DRAFT_768354 [Linnemannia elongata]